ncbi:hypothetical protein CEXT_696781 [Caerostris extrusa]|uniref:Uncharacterized protein n=1 Tax=Caerostris extrusa TaxID=172846 RepID=A0AAV4SW89_CAEEX|nr:hypothetical protein CEXT_696781 [Caerostris extrusa]
MNALDLKASKEVSLPILHRRDCDVMHRDTLTYRYNFPRITVLNKISDDVLNLLLNCVSLSEKMFLATVIPCLARVIHKAPIFTLM